MAGINDRRHNDNRVMCLRIFADARGETHMEDFEITFQPRKLFEENPLFAFRITSRLRGATSATSLREWVRWIGTIHLSVCLFSGYQARSNSRRAMAMFVGFQREASFWQRIRRAKDIFPATPLKASWSCMLRLPTTRALREALPVVAHRVRSISLAFG
jgi:hypothetical protein